MGTFHFCLLPHDETWNCETVVDESFIVAYNSYLSFLNVVHFVLFCQQVCHLDVSIRHYRHHHAVHLSSWAIEQPNHNDRRDRFWCGQEFPWLLSPLGLVSLAKRISIEFSIRSVNSALRSKPKFKIKYWNVLPNVLLNADCSTEINQFQMHS